MCLFSLLVTASAFSQTNRVTSPNTVMGGLQPLSTWIPFKKTISYTRNFSEKWSSEVEYSFGTLGIPVVGINIGGITEKNLSLVMRRFIGNSFHFILGAFHNTTEASVGRGYSLGKFGVENVGAVLGIGNRWQFEKGFTVGLDWLRMNLPMVNTRYDDSVLENITSTRDRNDVKKVLNYFNHVPTFTVLGVSAGYSF